MDFGTLALAGAKFILKGMSETKAYGEIKEDTLGGFWKWTKRVVFHKKPELENSLAALPDKEKQETLSSTLQEMIKEETFRKELEGWVTTLGNVFEGEIDKIGGNAHIGDKRKAGSNSPSGSNNVFKGKIGKIGGNFHLGNEEK
jgi:hypothetical protein